VWKETNVIPYNVIPDNEPVQINNGGPTQVNDRMPS